MITEEDITKITLKIVGALEPKFGSIDRRFVAIDERLEQIDRRFLAIDKRLDQFEERFANIEIYLDQFEERFRHVEAEIVRTTDILMKYMDESIKQSIEELARMVATGFTGNDESHSSMNRRIGETEDACKIHSAYFSGFKQSLSINES